MIEEEALFVRPDMADQQVRLDRNFVEEMLRRLHEADLTILEQRHRAPKEAGLRHEIGVKYRHELRSFWLSTQMSQSVVDIAGLGMRVVGPGQVVDTLAAAQGCKPLAVAIIEHPDPHQGCQLP